MDLDVIARRRLRAQRLHGEVHLRPEDAVRGLLAVQSQDFEPAAWSVAMRTEAPSLDAFGRAFDEGRILRTHILRPTWHFVAPEDLRWLQTLTAPRVQARNQYRYRQLDLDPDTLDRAMSVLADALGDQHLTRPELGQALATAGIGATGQRLGYVAMHAELEQVICSGPRRGAQQTYALVDDRAPAAAPMDREEALAELAVRFFAGHGPATDRDLQLWASLTAADVAVALEAAGPRLERLAADDRTFHAAGTEPPPMPSPTVHLLQAYDEYISGALDSRDVHARGSRVPTIGPGVRKGLVLLDGLLAGKWRRTIGRNVVTIEVATEGPFGAAQRAALQEAVDRYAAYLGLEAELVSTSATPRTT